MFLTFFQKIDFFGSKFHFYSGKTPIRGTTIGGFLTLFILIMFFLLIIIFGDNLFSRKNAFQKPVKPIVEERDDEIENVKNTRNSQKLIKSKELNDKTKELIGTRSIDNPTLNKSQRAKNKNFTLNKENFRAKSPITLSELEKNKNINEMKLWKNEGITTITNENMNSSINTLNTIFKHYEEDTTIKFEPIKFTMLPGYPLFLCSLRSSS